MDNWIMPFPVMSLYRFDLYWVNLTQEQVDAFTDEDMCASFFENHPPYSATSFLKHIF